MMPEPGQRSLAHSPGPSFTLSKLYDEYEEATKDEIKNFSRNQLRVWRGGRKRVVRSSISLAISPSPSSLMTMASTTVSGGVTV